ncbi:MAG: hypothetical protein LBP35_03385 [Candidatus Ancillula trichonymphae]|nr:hypothetical protein [Candidatus Ancillula trichonymphae]
MGSEGVLLQIIPYTSFASRQEIWGVDQNLCENEQDAFACENITQVAADVEEKTSAALSNSSVFRTLHLRWQKTAPFILGEFPTLD